MSKRLIPGPSLVTWPMISWPGMSGSLGWASSPSITWRSVRQTAHALIRIKACAVCRTDLHVIDGELAQPKLPLIPGHEIIGQVTKLGPGISRFDIGARVGVPWLGWACGACAYCRTDRENLCDRAKFTG